MKKARKKIIINKLNWLINSKGKKKKIKSESKSYHKNTVQMNNSEQFVFCLISWK